MSDSYSNACLNTKAPFGILKIRDENGEWVEGKDHVEEAIVQHFEGIFFSSNQVEVNKALEFVEKMVREDGNVDLQRLQLRGESRIDNVYRNTTGREKQMIENVGKGELIGEYDRIAPFKIKNQRKAPNSLLFVEKEMMKKNGGELRAVHHPYTRTAAQAYTKD
uniref:Uncharacterized protein n=1 Tax=Nelumbo nucifera TaxID=4432 RepID=A0A822Y098_NELNU|nr:TPA_asm: hypothetical protein HUJ06_026897 [Nelumbo nucifera]